VGGVITILDVPA